MTDSDILAPEEWHGTPGGYSNHRCRGERCRAAWRAEMAKNQAQRLAQGLAPGDSRHGTANGYRNYGCHCAACTRAQREQRRAKNATVQP